MRKVYVLSLLCLFYLLAGNGLAQNNILRGQIALQNSGGQPIAGVQISAPGASPTTSNSSGQFELVFSGKKTGARVQLILQKPGFEVVNRRDLTDIIRADPDDLMQIVMCKEGDRDRYARLYYEIAEQAIQTQYEQDLQQIRGSLEELTTQNQALSRLQAERDTAIARAKELAEKFAEVNLDEASDLYKQAFELFRAGKINQALEVLDDAKLDQALCNARAAKRKAELLAQQAETALQQSIDNFLLKARLSITTFQFAAAEKNYKKAIEADSSNSENIFEFALFLQKQNQFASARPLYETALSLTLVAADSATILNNLGILYKDINNYSAAQAAYELALEIREKLAEKNPDAYLSDVATSLNNLGNLHSDVKNYSEAQSNYRRALEIREKLAEKNPDAFLPDIAISFNNLGNLHSDTKDYSDAQAAYQRALDIYEKLAEKNPDTYLPYVATSLNNLGILYYNTKNYSDAQAAYQEALEIYKKLAEKNPKLYDLDLCATRINLGIFISVLLNENPDDSLKAEGFD